MVKKKTPTSDVQELQKSVDKLHETVRIFPKKYEWIFDPVHHLLFAFLRGVAYSVGFIVAIVIVIPLFVSLLRQVNWVPLVGDFLSDVSVRMEQTVSR
jgi:hypothetical protein